MSAAMPTMRRGPVLTPMNFVTGSVHMNVPVHGVHAREHAPGDALADDDDLVAVGPIALVEVAAGDESHAERVEEARRDGPEPRARILFAVGLR